MLDKPFTYWFALATAAAFVFERHKQKPLVSRLAIVSISAGIGHSLAPDFAIWTERSETMAVMLLTPLGYGLLSSLMALVSDRKEVIAVISALLPGGGDRRNGGDEE